MCGLSTEISTEYESAEHTVHFQVRVVATSCDLRVPMVFTMPLPEAPQLEHSITTAHKYLVLRAHEVFLRLYGIFALHAL